MDISVTGNRVTITGNIKTVGDYQKIKEVLDGLASKEKSIFIDITDSISITSSVIGYLTKLVQKDNIDLHIKVKNTNLYELFDEINLIRLFNISRG